MSHPQQQDFVVALKRAFPEFFVGGRVLEIGSLDINGGVRHHFAVEEYIGLDVGAGPGVDVVCQGQDYAAPDSSFDVTLSCETMEHNPHWRETFANMIRLCRPGGLVLMTCATTGRAEHGTSRTTPNDAPLITWDYYANRTAADFRQNFDLTEIFSTHLICRDLSFCDLLFAGFKSGSPSPVNAQKKLRAIHRGYLISNASGWRHWRKQALIALVGEQRYWAGSLLPWK